MPLLSIIRIVGALISLVILVGAAYLLWYWYRGDTLIDSDGDVLLIRDNRLLWAGIVLLAWSFVGKFFIPFVLARRTTRPTLPTRGKGRNIRGKTGSIYVEEAGKAGSPTIILTHGWSLDSTIWFYAKRDLGERFRLITWDLPGMGKSKPDSRDRIDLSNFAADLRQLIAENASAGPVVLVGHSIGGMTIQTLAKEHPEVFEREVSGIVLLNTTYTNPLRTMILSGLMRALQKPILEPAMRLTILLQPLVWLMAWQSYLSGWSHVANRFGFGKYVTRSQLEHVTLLTTRNAPGNLAKGNLAMFHWDATSALARVGVPILVVGGELDIITKPDASKEIASSALQARLQIIEGVNHMGFLERPEVCNGAIADFVVGVSGGRQ